MSIIHTSDCPEFFTEERCYIRELLNRPDQPQLSVAQARVAPGITTALHALEVEEVYYILHGKGEMERAGVMLGTVKPGDLVRIPAGQSQRITNTGPEDLVFLCICTPRFRQEAYRDMEAPLSNE